jgi:hypothetical protein
LPERQQDYASYLLRLWKAEGQGQCVWLASLESALTGERKNFASLAALVQFLQDQFGGRADSSQASESPQAGDAVGEFEPREGS